jgi:hypothetical protein
MLSAEVGTLMGVRFNSIARVLTIHFAVKTVEFAGAGR